MKRRRLLEVLLVVALVACFLAFYGRPEPDPPSPPSVQPSPPVTPRVLSAMPGFLECRDRGMPYEVTPELLRQGRAVFEGQGQCNTCHGDRGKGDGPAGVVLDPPPTDLTNADSFKYGSADWMVFRTVYHGVPDTAMVAQRESAGGSLTREQAWQVTAYVLSLHPKQEALRPGQVVVSTVQDAIGYDVDTPPGSAIDYSRATGIWGPRLSPSGPTPPPAGRFSTLPGGTRVTVLKDGSGRPARKGDRLSVHYTGWLTDGTKFDSSFDRSQPFEFLLGEGQCIPGWEDGVEGMRVGEARRLEIPPNQAYGDRATGPIPANSTLIFQVDLLSLEPGRP